MDRQFETLLVTGSENKSKRWRPRFSIMGIMVATAFCAVLLTWWADRTRLLQEMEAAQAHNDRLQQLMAAMSQDMSKRLRKMDAMEARSVQDQMTTLWDSLRNKALRSEGEHENDVNWQVIRELEAKHRNVVRELEAKLKRLDKRLEELRQLSE